MTLHTSVAIALWGSSLNAGYWQGFGIFVLTGSSDEVISPNPATWFARLWDRKIFTIARSHRCLWSCVP
ncbi:hypothetical protein N7533_004007 [Penicillium manginii]|uniref:uncharacterized protein n=1 Tax=Penicillium manginii TaxID=203109 RepID=UPI0025492AAC|nr:uncharacterized protein N7533_004007 [Penicillium manginii]KAJ5754464.1 hypothetical protein N7533_004007 [Penicillium manginii]